MEAVSDEQDQTGHHNGTGPKINYSSGNNPGRRFGERGNVTLPSNDEVRRLFGREGRQEPSDFHPAPRPRDEKGQVQQRTIVHDPAMPDPAQLREKYGAALALIREYRPLRAALLDDMIGRIEYSQARFRRLEAGEEHRFQNRNEEFRRADTWLDNRIVELRSERKKQAENFDTQISERQEALAQARELASVARVAAGMPLHFKDLDTELTVEADTDQKADLAEIEQAAAQAALPAVADTATSLRQIGGLLSRLRGQGRVAIQANSPTQAQPELNTERMTKAYADSVPFLLAEGIEQARPEAAIAVEQGLPLRSPAAGSLKGRQQWISWIALLACGSLFGISMGLLTQVLNLDLVALNPGRVAWKIAILVTLGIAMFWVIGRVVYAMAAIASEERHAHLLASHRDDTVEVGNWLKRASFWAMGLLPLSGIILVGIEAQVERFGIVRVFADGSKNAAFASGHEALAAPKPPEFAIFCLVLTVSLPFVLFHMAEGWAHARDEVISQYLAGRRYKEGWEIAQKCHQDRTARTLAHFEEKFQEAKDNAKATLSLAAPNYAALTIQAELADTKVAEENGDVIPSTDPPRKLEEPAVRMVDVALAMERARECYARVREARARRQEALAWYETRIAAYEDERQRERTEPENASKLRLEDAYSDYLGAVMEFDKTYRQEMILVEKFLRGGILMRLWLALMRRPISA